MRSRPTFRLLYTLRVLTAAALLLPFAACDSSDPNDGTAPAIIAASSDGATVSVIFSVPLNPTSVTAAAFTLSPGPSVASASASGANVTLVLATPLDDSESRTYVVTANGIRDTAGNVGNGLSATFSFGQGGSGSSTAIGAAYPNAGDSRIVLLNTSGNRFIVFNPVTGAATGARNISDIENGLIPLDNVGATASVFNNSETYFFSTDGDTFTRYRRNVADFSTPRSFDDEYDESGFRLNSIGAAVEGDFFTSDSIVLFNQNGTEWQLWQPSNNGFSGVFTFPAQFGGGNSPISAVGAAVYRSDTNQVYLFSRNGTQYTIWSGGSSFTAAFPVEELGSYTF